MTSDGTVAAMAIIAFMFFAGLVIGDTFHPTYVPEKCSIPSQQQINNLCVSIGFNDGWLSSSACGAGQVQCHQKIGSMEKFECVNWNEAQKQ